MRTNFTPIYAAMVASGLALTPYGVGAATPTTTTTAATAAPKAALPAKVTTQAPKPLAPVPKATKSPAPVATKAPAPAKPAAMPMGTAKPMTQAPKPVIAAPPTAKLAPPVLAKPPAAVIKPTVGLAPTTAKPAVPMPATKVYVAQNGAAPAKAPAAVQIQPYQSTMQKLLIDPVSSFKVATPAPGFNPGSVPKSTGGTTQQVPKQPTGPVVSSTPSNYVPRGVTFTAPSVVAGKPAPSAAPVATYAAKVPNDGAKIGPATQPSYPVQYDMRGGYITVPKTTNNALTMGGSLATNQPTTTTTEKIRVGPDRLKEVAGKALDVVSTGLVVVDVLNSGVSPGPDVGLLAAPIQAVRKGLQTEAITATKSAATKLGDVPKPSPVNVGPGSATQQVRTTTSVDSIVVGKVNPTAPAPKAGTNCVNCSIVTEARYGGQAASALPSNTKAFAEAERMLMTKASPRTTLDTVKIQALPVDGSRAVVAGYGANSGHAFNAIRLNGSVVFYDRQTASNAARILTEQQLRTLFTKGFSFIRTN